MADDDDDDDDERVFQMSLIILQAPQLADDDAVDLMKQEMKFQYFESIGNNNVSWALVSTVVDFVKVGKNSWNDWTDEERKSEKNEKKKSW